MAFGRNYHFSAGPATLPEEVIIQAQDELLNYRRRGFSILEASHRSESVKETILSSAHRLLDLLGLDDRYRVLFLHGGASTAFFQIPMNLLKKGDRADYIETGLWVQKAVVEAKRFGEVHIAASSAKDHFRHIPKGDDLRFSLHPKYIYLCSNNTVFGTQYRDYPRLDDVPLVGDFSSDILSEPRDLSCFGLIFAGAQKNLGPAGVAVVIIREDILSQCSEDIPSMCSYKVHAKNESLYNTPPVFPIYFIEKMLLWIEGQGGLEAIGARNREKAHLVYEEIDRTDFYTGTSAKTDRSMMNVTFTLPTESLSKQFVEEAETQGLGELKGHRSIGGIRASMYNAFPVEGAKALAAFMRCFAQKY